MKSTIMLSVLTLGAILAGAQITFNPDGSFTCPAGKSAFCAAGSLTTNIIFRCNGTVAQPGNCNDNLAGVPPPGVKDSARCWECSPTAGDASCSYNGTVYPDAGSPFTIASGNASCNTTSGAPIGNATTPNATASASVPINTPVASTEASTPVNKPLPTFQALYPINYGSTGNVSLVNNLASGAALTTTSTISHTMYATISLEGPDSSSYASGAAASSAIKMVAPSSVPVAPGSGGLASNSSSNSSTAANAVTSVVVVAPSSTGYLPAQTSTAVNSSTAPIYSSFAEDAYADISVIVSVVCLTMLTLWVGYELF